MRNTVLFALMGLIVGGSAVNADVSEMVFYPDSDFSEGILHFNYQGDKNKNYGFMFDKGFDTNRIVYVRPDNYAIEKQSDGNIKLSFPDTDRYAYIQKANKDDFLVSNENGIIKILLSGGDCKGSWDCVTGENLLTVNVPKGYNVRKYQGLDQDLKPLANPQWQLKGNTYTLAVHNVKGACIMMELEKLKPGQKPTIVAVAETKPLLQVPQTAPIKPLVPPSVSVVPPQEKPLVKPVEKPTIVKPEPVISGTPASYFRNFQLFDNRIVALNPAGKERLNEWAKQFMAGNYSSVTINAYTDNIPPQRLKALYATNEILSEARAQAVADYLVSKGISASSITVVGKGDADPAFSNDTEEGRSKNRRVEFVLSR